VSRPAPIDRAAFDHAEDLTVGAEEELLLLDAETLDLAPVAKTLVLGLDDRSRFRQEFSAAQIEIVTGVRHTAVALADELAEGRRRVIAQTAGRVRLMGSGAHPFTAPWSKTSAGPRFDALLDAHGVGARLGALAAGLHVHVAVRGADRALAVYNGLREVMPLLIALSANAPFIAGRHSGLATVRCLLCDALPRHGTGPALERWSDLESLVSWGRISGAVPDPSQYWWDCRLNLRTGTVEVRAPDSQSSLDDAEALISVVHAAAADLARRHDGGEPMAVRSSTAIDEDRWRAARHGVAGTLVDQQIGALRPARAVIGALLDRIEPAAAALGGTRGIHHARLMLERDTPATLHSIARADGLPGLCRWLSQRTEQAARRDGSARDASGTDAAWTSAPPSPPTRTAR
jgi:glutamate---cysteine ligase / carboxylate-amine ligase